MPISSLFTSIAAYLLMLGGFNFTYTPQTDRSGTASIEISSSEALSAVTVKLVGDNGKTIEKRVSVRAGKPTVVRFKQKDREVNYQLLIEANEAYTEASITVRRPVSGGKQGNFTVLSDREEIVDRRQIRFQTPFTLSSTTFQVFDTEGNLIVDELVTDQVIEAGQTITKNWCSTEEVFMIKFTGEDETGANATDSRVPWAVHIPHTEVQFDSGKAVINSDQAPKVDAAYAVLAHELDGLERVNAAVHSNLTAQLYIVGYTDTVGNAGDNQKLSEKRARAIARYFKEKGAWCEIYYAGMGERGLAAQTGDGVDSQANRRALYLLGVQKPSGGGQVPGPSKWKKLSEASSRPAGTLPELPPAYYEYKERSRKDRLAKFADTACTGPGGGNTSGSTSGSSGLSSAAQESEGSSSVSDDEDASAVAPLAMGDKPGATAKGCAVDTTPGPLRWAGFVGVFALLGIRSRRARFRRNE